MKELYVEPKIDIFMFNAVDTVVASAVLPTDPADSNLGEDIIGDGESSGEDFVW